MDRTIPLQNDIDRETPEKSLYIFFAVTWASYGILHVIMMYWNLLYPASTLELLFRLLLVVSGFFVLGKPSSVGRFIVMCIAWLGTSLSYAPYWPNHVFHTVVINAALLLLLLFAWMGVGKGATTRERTIAMFAPVGRLSLFVLYFWVVVHKLNYDYLNPTVSCGWVLYKESAVFIKDMTGLTVPTQSWMSYPCLLGALLLEALIPVLLFFRKTRFVGLVFGCLFHLVLSFHHNMFILSFTLMMYAHFTLFTTQAARENCLSWWRDSWLGQNAITPRGVLLPMMLMALFALYIVPFGITVTWPEIPKADIFFKFNRKMTWRIFHVCATAYLLVYLGLMIRFQWPPRNSRSNYRHEPTKRMYLPHPAWLAAFPALLLLNGVTPYVGLKTHHNYAMFSNLQTEASTTNHLFLPASLRIANYQDDLIHVLESNYEATPAMEPGVQMTRFEFRRALMKAPRNLRLVYSDNGSAPKTLTYELLQKDESLSAEPWLVRHLLFFKTALPEDEPCPCRW